MPMSDDLTGVVLSNTQKSMEIAAELIKMIAPTLKKGTEMLFTAFENHESSGAVAKNQLFEQAANAKSCILSNSNFLSSDREVIAAKAAQYKIPVSFVGNGEKVTMSYLDRDKAEVNQILQEVVQERMREAPQSVKAFPVSESNVNAIKASFEAEGLECNFVKGANGKIYCAYPANDAEKVAAIKTEFKNAYSEVGQSCVIDTNLPDNQRQLDIKADISKLESRLSDLKPTKQTYISAAKQLNDEDFPAYSANNQKLIIEQNPDAVRVAGKAKWESLGYKVDENARGIQILAPQTDKTGKPVLDSNGNPNFEKMTVYDISETNAADSVLQDEKKAIQRNIAELKKEYSAEKAKAFAQIEDKQFIISDSVSGKSVEITADSNLRKNDLKRMLKEQLGFSELKSELATNKICDDLGLDPHKYFQPVAQLDKIDRLKVNIKYKSDSILLKDTTFSSLAFKDAPTHIFVTHGDNAITLTPSKMTETEMKNSCMTHLEMSEEQAAETVNKAVRIDTQLNSKIKETAIFRETGEAQTVTIDRTSNSSFSVLVGTKKREYNFNDKSIADKMSKDYGITTAKAQTIIDKAKRQSTFQNNISRIAKSAKEKSTKLTKEIKEKVGKTKGVR